jgi:hypothetical protein
MKGFLPSSRIEGAVVATTMQPQHSPQDHSRERGACSVTVSHRRGSSKASELAIRRITSTLSIEETCPSPACPQKKHKSCIFCVGDEGFPPPSTQNGPHWPGLQGPQPSLQNGPSAQSSTRARGPVFNTGPRPSLQQPKQNWSGPRPKAKLERPRPKAEKHTAKTSW